MPPLPPDVARHLLAGLRSRTIARKREAMDALLATRAFAAGFIQGADSERARRAHVVEMDHEHWLRGYEAGQAAAAAAAARYLGDRLGMPSAALDARSTAPGPPRSDAATAARTPRHARVIRVQPSPQLTLF